MVAPLVVGGLVAAGAIGAWVIDSVAAAFETNQQTAAQIDTNQAIQVLNSQGNIQAATALAQAQQVALQNQNQNSFDLGQLTQLLPIVIIAGLVKGL